MKYFVKIPLTPEAGKNIEARPGGPKPVVERILNRFKPEAVYMTCSERTMLMFVDLANPADITELTIVGADIARTYPTFTPVISGKDFESVVSKAIPSAQEILKN